FAPIARKRAGSRRKSTISCSSALASSAPATSSQPIDALESGLISCGLVFGISFIVRQIRRTSTSMKTIGAQLKSAGWILSDHRLRWAADGMSKLVATGVDEGYGVGVGATTVGPALDISNWNAIAPDYRRNPECLAWGLDPILLDPQDLAERGT